MQCKAMQYQFILNVNDISYIEFADSKGKYTGKAHIFVLQMFVFDIGSKFNESIASVPLLCLNQYGTHVMQIIEMQT